MTHYKEKKKNYAVEDIFAGMVWSHLFYLFWVKHALCYNARITEHETT